MHGYDRARRPPGRPPERTGRAREPVEARPHREVSLKKSALLGLLLAVGIASGDNGARYLVICADSLYNSIQPLAQWKQATGLSTKVVRLSEIPGGSDTLAIKEYIKVAWSNWPVRPEYVLVAGSGSLVPSRLYRQSGRVYVSSDNLYGDMTGDFAAELPVGRLPAANPAQLDVMVAKALKYQKEPDLTDSLWMRRMTTVIREGGDQDDTLYWGNIRNAARKAATAGFVSCDSFSYFRGHSSANVTTSCNQGTGIVLYRGTASGNWYTPFDGVRPGTFTSTNKLCIMTSITCQTLTLVPYEEMICDSWIRAGSLADLRGAAAVVGNTHSASEVADLRGAVARGFFDGLFDEGIYVIGKTLLRAKAQLKLEFPGYTSDYRGFNLYGDPAMGIWTTTPRRPTVTHPASLEPVPQDLSVTVSCDASPIESALVCASMDSTVYAYGYTDAGGHVILPINPASQGSLRLVVTGRNLYPHDTVIPVVRTAVDEPIAAGQPGRAGFFATCSPNPTPGFAVISLAGALSGVRPVSLRVHDAQGRAVTSPFDTRTSSFRLDLRSMPAGVYVVVLRDAAGNSLGQARLLKVD